MVFFYKLMITIATHNHMKKYRKVYLLNINQSRLDTNRLKIEIQ